MKASAPPSAPATRALSLRMGSPTLADVYQQVAKAHATRKLAGRTKWRGCDISLEHQAGGIRKGVDKNGVPWQTEMRVPYGYFRGTQAQQQGDLGDADHLDCFLCGDEETDTVYVVHIVNPENFAYDEDKLLLNASSAKEAYDIFAQHYDQPEKFFGAMTELPAEQVAQFVKAGKDNWEKPLVPRARTKVHLQRAAMTRTHKAMEEEREWKRALVEKGELAWADEVDWGDTSKAEGVTDGEQKRRDHIYSEFHRLCNMSGAQVLAFAASEDGKKAGLSRGEAAKQGIASGRSRPKQIAHLKSTAKGSWTSGDYAIAGRIVNFISRMSGAGGPLKDDKGNLSRRATSLKIWGNDPFRSTSKAVDAPADEDMEDVSKAISLAHEAVSKAVMTPTASDDGRRLIKIQPSWEAIDLQNEYVAKQVIRDAWAYYEVAGNVDLEHLTKKGGETFQEYAAALKAQGFEIPEKDAGMGRMYYEIGRPVAGSFDPETCTFTAEIRKGEPAADWFWSTMTGPTPRVWKPSIGGAARYVDAIVQNVDPMFHLDIKQKVKSMKLFRWTNIGLTLEPVCHWVPPVEIIRDTAVSKGVDMPTEPTSSPLTAGAAIRDAMYAAAEYAVSEMRDSDQISSVTAGRMLGEVSKALEAIADEGVLTTEVSKALDYGTVTTDSAQLTGGGAAMRSGLGDYRKKRAAKDLYDLTMMGETPFQKGFDFGEDPSAPVAEYLMAEEGYDDDDSLDIAELFLKRVAAKIAGR